MEMFLNIKMLEWYTFAQTFNSGLRIYLLRTSEYFLHCALAAAQCIVSGPVCGWVCVLCVCVCVSVGLLPR